MKATSRSVLFPCPCLPFFFLKDFFFIHEYVCVCVFVSYVQAPTEAWRGCQSPGAGNRWLCLKWLDVHAGSQDTGRAQVLSTPEPSLWSPETLKTVALYMRRSFRQRVPQTKCTQQTTTLYVWTYLICYSSYNPPSTLCAATAVQIHYGILPINRMNIQSCLSFTKSIPVT
jgi:hypothetical protein